MSDTTDKKYKTWTEREDGMTFYKVFRKEYLNGTEAEILEMQAGQAKGQCALTMQKVITRKLAPGSPEMKFAVVPIMGDEEENYESFEKAQETAERIAKYLETVN